MLSANYTLAYADGLNRYYVPHEHSELLSAFKYPPNVYDNFVSAQLQDAQSHIARVEEHATRLEEHATRLEEHAARLEEHAAGVEEYANNTRVYAEHVESLLKSMQSSYSWRITAPMRRGVNVIRRMIRRIKG